MCKGEGAGVETETGDVETGDDVTVVVVVEGSDTVVVTNDSAGDEGRDSGFDCLKKSKLKAVPVPC